MNLPDEKPAGTNAADVQMSAQRAFDAFGARLKRLYRELGTTQAEIAKRTGIPQSMLSKYESGERLPSFENLMRLRIGLGVSLERLAFSSLDQRDFLAGLTLYERQLVADFVDMLARRRLREPQTESL